MDIPIVQVDAFTDTRFAGNPAAVCILPVARDERWMQDVAREMNLSETAFLHPVTDGYQLRWFTPTVEVALCGHATLASAHVLWEAGHLVRTAPARFHTKSGLLTAERRGEWIELDFPATPAAHADAPPGLVEGLGVQPNVVSRSRFDYLVEVDTEDTVRRLRRISRARPHRRARRHRDEQSVHAHVRFCVPVLRSGVRYQRGSRHGLNALRARTLLERTPQDRARGLSGFARGGVIRTRLQGDRVILGGQAVTVLRGTLVELSFRSTRMTTTSHRRPHHPSRGILLALAAGAVWERPARSPPSCIGQVSRSPGSDIGGRDRFRPLAFLRSVSPRAVSH
jgi:predicted PhzF superfamily epimerase YddE/YHI9